MIRIFNNLDEMFKAIAADRAVADARIQDWQHDIDPGDYVVYSARGFMIYGEIVDPVEQDRKYYNFDNPEDREEFEFVKESYGPVWAASYRHGRWFSELCPEGELGDVHRSQILAKISKTAFEAARAKGWPNTCGLS